MSTRKTVIVGRAILTGGAKAVDHLKAVLENPPPPTAPHVFKFEKYADIVHIENGDKLRVMRRTIDVDGNQGFYEVLFLEDSPRARNGTSWIREAKDCERFYETVQES